MPRFTAKQKAFIAHYLITLNATKAAQLAGYGGNNHVLRSIGSENLSKPDIRAEIDRRLSKLTMSAEEVLKRTSDIASGDLAEYISGGELDIEALKADGRGYLLKKYKITTRTIPRKDDEPMIVETVEAELYPADAAHDKLMRYHGLYKEKDQPGTEDNPLHIKFVDYGLEANGTDAD